MTVLRRAIPRLSRVWMPSSGMVARQVEDAHGKLIRAGFLRQAQPGIFHMLPLGQRVQEKLERLIVRHMEEKLGASKVSLSTISTEELWTKSGRLSGNNPELFRFSDRKDAKYLLSPTHEEEITNLVARSVTSYKDLPLRLYQITRKYRDEARPRHGLLRGREFTMKDLYTFDLTPSAALGTYQRVREAYDAIFAALKLPVRAARASSGDMGGDLSHEYHLATELGEDHVVSCDSCAYVANEELARISVRHEGLRRDGDETSWPPTRVWRGISKDRATLVNLVYPGWSYVRSTGQRKEFSEEDVNVTPAKVVVPDLDTAVSDALPFWKKAVFGEEPTAKKLVNIFDERYLLGRSDNPSEKVEVLSWENKDEGDDMWPVGFEDRAQELGVVVKEEYAFSTDDSQHTSFNLLRAKRGDACPECDSGKLDVQKAIELGHTFHLGTRYSVPLEATVAVPTPVLKAEQAEEAGDKVEGVEKLATKDATDSAPGSVARQTVPMQMGCHGIGVSRIIGAVADHLADKKGLNWPAAIAPYSCVITPARPEYLDDALEVYKTLAASAGRDDGAASLLDMIVDDRNGTLPRRLTDADLVGIPVILVLGNAWRESRKVEVQCRRLQLKEFATLEELPGIASGLLEKL